MAQRRVRPLRQYSRPGIPIRSDVDRDPKLLQSLPRRWQGNQAVMSALVASCLLMSSRGLADCEKQATPVSRVAPVFQHGYGHTVPGTMSGPIFLPEDEARQLIEEEAKRAGLAFVKCSTTVPNVGLTMKAWGKRDQYVTWKTAVKLDGIDTARRIAYEYVSADDSRQWSIGSENFGQGYRTTFDAATACKKDWPRRSHRARRLSSMTLWVGRYRSCLARTKPPGKRLRPRSKHLVRNYASRSMTSSNG